MPPKPIPADPRTRDKPVAATHVTVELDTGTWVVERGVEHRRWRVNIDGLWCDADHAPGANVVRGGDDADTAAGEFLVRPPGCQYLCRARLLLPVGSELELLITRPREIAAAASRDILSWLKHPKPPRVTTVRHFRVGRTGRLVPESSWQKMRGQARARRSA